MTVVPAPGADVTVSDPPIASSRSAMPRQPVPCAAVAGSNPAPSSVISNVRCPFDCASRTSTREASAYFAMF